MTDPSQNKALARRYVELVNQSDGDGVAELFTEDGAVWLPSRTLLPPGTEGRENVCALINSLGDWFPETGLNMIIDEMTAEEDRVSVVAHSDAVHLSGRPYQNRYHLLLRFVDGKISASYEYMDSLLVTQVLLNGAMPPPPGE
ncbi:MAG: nuclear transport factor 2 family protein [Sphingomonadaceae bacterium]